MVLFIELHYNGRKLKITNTVIISKWGNVRWKVQQLVRVECPLAGEQGWKYGFHYQSLCSFGYIIPADMLVLTGAQEVSEGFWASVAYWENWKCDFNYRALWEILLSELEYTIFHSVSLFISFILFKQWNSIHRAYVKARTTASRLCLK